MTPAGRGDRGASSPAPGVPSADGVHPARPRPAAADGAAALLVVGVVTGALLVVTAATWAVVLAGVLGARAQTAADLAALAAVSASPLAGGPDLDGRGAAVDLAREVAERNGAVLVAVDADGWPLEVAVVVEAAATALPRWLRAVPTATAAAALRPPASG